MMDLTKKEKDAIKAARRAYQKEYYKKNKEKHKEAMQKYWLKKAAEMGLV